MMVKFMDYIICYVMFKTMRTLVPVTIVIAVILAARKVIDTVCGKRNPVPWLYVRTYMWFLLLPVSFMGGLKFSLEYSSVRSRLYVLLYKYFMVNPIWGKLYLLGIVVMSAILLFRRVKLRRWIRRLPLYDHEAPELRKEKYLPAVQIRITDLMVTPFTAGIFKPVIVLPSYILEEFDAKEIETVLQHEYCHIRRGHLFLYGIMDLLRILWFVHPLVHYSAKLVKNDLELICDNAAIRTNTYNPENYAKTLLKSIAFLQEARVRGESHKGVPAFIGETSYNLMKKRIKSIAAYREYSKGYFRRVYVLAGALILMSLFLVRLGSYPAYTPYEGYSFYCGGKGAQLIFDNNEQFNKAIKLTDEGLLVDNVRVREMLNDITLYNDLGEYWIYFGGYSKLPGIGGGGDVVFYTSEDMLGDEILLPYNERSAVERLLEWILKHI